MKMHTFLTTLHCSTQNPARKYTKLTYKSSKCLYKRLCFQNKQKNLNFLSIEKSVFITTDQNVMDLAHRLPLTVHRPTKTQKSQFLNVMLKEKLIQSNPLDKVVDGVRIVMEYSACCTTYSRGTNQRYHFTGIGILQIWSSNFINFTQHKMQSKYAFFLFSKLRIEPDLGETKIFLPQLH